MKMMADHYRVLAQIALFQTLVEKGLLKYSAFRNQEKRPPPHGYFLTPKGKEILGDDWLEELRKTGLLGD